MPDHQQRLTPAYPLSSLHTFAQIHKQLIRGFEADQARAWVFDVEHNVDDDHCKDSELLKRIYRKVHAQMPAKTEYRLTKASEDLQEVYQALLNWGTRHKDFFRDLGVSATILRP